MVGRDHANIPTEVADKLFQLKQGEVSDVISTSSDYFIVSATEKIDENRMRVALIRIKAKDMSEYLKEYRSQKKVSEYIKLPLITSQTVPQS